MCGPLSLIAPGQEPGPTLGTAKSHCRPGDSEQQTSLVPRSSPPSAPAQRAPMSVSYVLQRGREDRPYQVTTLHCF